jgi:hypothetical protein
MGGLRFCRKPPGQIELAGSKRLARRLAEPPSFRREQHQGFQIGSAAGAAAGGPKTGLAYGTAHGPARLVLPLGKEQQFLERARSLIERRRVAGLNGCLYRFVQSNGLFAILGVHHVE